MIAQAHFGIYCADCTIAYIIADTSRRHSPENDSPVTLNGQLNALMQE
jgi:hypothetical protein